MIGKNDKNNLTIALNVSYAKYPAYVSKHNWNCQKQVILLMIQMVKDGIISCNKKSLCIIMRSNAETLWWFLLIQLPSFLRNTKQTWF